MDNYRETFNDGVVYYGHKKTELSENKKIIGKKFIVEGKLYYRELNARESDYLSCHAMGSKLEVKLKTLYPRSFKTINKDKLTAKINNTEYEVIKVDSDKHYLYFYLSKVGEISDSGE